MASDDARDLFEEIVSLVQRIDEEHQEATVLFADLAGSTEFKVRAGPVLGLQKTYIHNSLVTKTANGRGEVVKYVGDEVMIVVDGSGSPAITCRLAIDIQRELATLNGKHPNDPLFPIETKIGIHYGKLLYWRYPGHDQRDPQGTVVDTAARIVSLAKPQQILCSVDTASAAKLSSNETSQPEERDVKGIRESIKVVEVLWDGTARRIAEQPLPVVEDPELRRLTREAREEMLRGNVDGGASLLRSALGKAPKDFQANLLLGELLSRQSNQVTEGRKYLDRARRSNPCSAKLWLLEGFLEWYTGNRGVDRSALNRAIEYTERSLELADAALDYEQGRLAQGNLAYYLAQREGDGDVDRALRLCENVRNRYDAIETRQTSGFLDTYAFVLLKKGGEDNIRKARELLEEAMKRDRQNPYPHEHMAELIRKEQAVGIKPVTGSTY